MPATCCKKRWDRLLIEDPDMPVFTLHGKDLLAIETIEFWLSRATERGVNENKLQGVRNHLEAMKQFKINNLDRMQLPD